MVELPDQSKFIMKKINYKNILLKKNKEPLACLTAYSKSLASILDGRVDLVLIGDSLGTTLYGMKNTRSVSLEMMKYHGRAVVKNTKKSLTIIDMPFNTYNNNKEALKNAKDILKFTKADFIKIETDKNNIGIVEHLTKNKIKVVSHIGVTPQKFSDFRKIKSVGRSKTESNNLLNLAKKLEYAGSKLIVLECIHYNTSKKITKNLNIPTIGIGSSKYCDGQVLVIDDILNLDSNEKKPKFIKTYTNIQKEITKAVRSFINDVRNKKFPTKKYSY